MSIFKYTKIKNLASNISFFYFCLGLCPSLPVAYKYLGFVGLICYLTLTYYILLIFQRNYKFLFRNLRVIFSAFFLLSISLFLIVYPWANARSSIGKGSDRDEALHIGVGRILRGLYPYSHQDNTYFDNPVSPLPGNLILHIPAQLFLGNSLYTEPVLLVIAFLALVWISKKLALFTLVSCTISLEFWRDFLTGGDLASTTIFIFAMSLAFLKYCQQRNLKLMGVTGFILGLALSSRITNLVYLLAVFVCLKELKSTQRFLVTFYPLLIFTSVTIPFYLYKPEEFSPAVALDKSAGLLGIFLVLLSIAVYFFLASMNHSSMEEKWILFVKFLSPIGFFVAIIPTSILRDFSLLAYSYTTASLGLIFMLVLKTDSLGKPKVH